MIAQKIKIFFRDQDYFLLLPVLALCAIGLLSIYSATRGTPEMEYNFIKQLVNLGIGLIILVFVILIPIRLIDSAALSVYTVSLILLTLLFVFGSVRYGAQRWFSIGPLSLQPSELAKLGTIL
ncbi:MAG: FtsW/RodA/SpoVE family cell cycle protein, partial [Bacteroidetes bacterium]|nr:FtsW/RodA/SpoVE family cell cycle protein [Bacteroidota bacterium]